MVRLPDDDVKLKKPLCHILAQGRFFTTHSRISERGMPARVLFQRSGARIERRMGVISLPMGERRLERWARYLLYCAMVVATILWVVRPFNDPDFFWHLKTGEWIWQHGELPSRDPFNFTNQAVDSAAARFTLKAYWLSQVVYHLIHGAWGMPGIVALKLLLAATLVLTLLKLRRGDQLVNAALTLTALPLFFGVYPFDRPQAFSFVYFALLLVFLERERTAVPAPAGWASYLPIPLLMLVWANTHGGHAMGQMTIGLYLVLEGVKFAHPALQPAGKDRYRRLLILGLAGLGSSLVNPNSWQALATALFLGSGTSNNAEFLSTVRFFGATKQSLIFVYWGALVLAALASLSTITKPDITRLALLAGTGAYGFFYVRHIPFFMIAAVPVIAAFLSAERARKWAPYALAAGSVVLAAWFSRAHAPSRERIAAALAVNESQFPVRAADFVLANDLAGNLYNTWAWGGYLLWRLAPERKVFVDGRGLNPQVNIVSSSIALAMPQAPTSPLHWKNILRQYSIGYLVIPSRRGYFIDSAAGLRNALREAPEWVPVYADDTALVYALNMPAHRGVIERHGIPKERLPAGE
jgi:hypothetical protein